MIMCVLLCYPVSIRIYYQQGVLFLVFQYCSVWKVKYIKNKKNTESRPLQRPSISYIASEYNLIKNPSKDPASSASVVKTAMLCFDFLDFS